MSRTTQQRTFRIISRTAKINALKAVKDLMKEDNAEVIIRPYKENKTGEQRNWFHKLCQILGDECGYTKGEIKEMVKHEVLGTKQVTIGGKTREVAESSEAEDRKGYSLLIDGIYRIGAEAGIVLPNPRYRGG